MARTETASARSATALILPDKIGLFGRSAIVYRWFLSRALTLMVMGFAFSHEAEVSGDVSYYARSLHSLFTGASLHDTLQEYPLPVLALMVPQFLLGALNQVAFTILFALTMLAVDGIFTAWLWRSDGRHRGDATNLWLWFVPAIGPMAYFRFDLVPAVLAGGAVLVAIRRPALAGALTAVGACLKLWPAVMLPTFLIRRVDRRAVLGGFFFTGIVVAAATISIGGLSRSLSPLHWQSARGLQIESVIGTPLMFGRMLSHDTWHLGISRYKAWEIYGPGVNTAIQLASVATVIGGLLLAWMWWRAHMLKSVSATTLGWVFLSTALIVTVTNKTLSPQYLLWMGGPIAALAVRSPRDPSVRHFGRVLLMTALLTQLVYPIGYGQLVSTHALLPVPTLLLTARNLLLLYLTWYAVRQVWQQTRRSSTS